MDQKTITKLDDIPQEELNTDKKAKKNNSKNAKKPKKFNFILLIIAIVFILVTMVYFNVGNVTDKYLRNVPIIKNILPPQNTTNKYNSYSKNKLVSTITDFEKQLENRDNEIKDLTQKNQDLNKEIENLKVFQQQYDKWKKDKEKFDQMVATQDTKSYIEFYQKMDPENASNIYKQLVGDQVKTKEIKKYVAQFDTMDNVKAAAILEQMVKTDLDLVAQILKNLDSDKRGKIIQEMSEKNAATVTKKLSPS